MASSEFRLSSCLLTFPLHNVIPVERYDPRSNRWTPVAPMGTRRKHLGVAVYNGMIYAVGGRDDATELSSAERYNPQNNAWQPIIAMTSRRSGVGIQWSLSSKTTHQPEKIWS